VSHPSQNGTRRFVLVNNIPTPYRVHLFGALCRALGERRIDFEVWFMARTEPGRYWHLDSADWHFPHRFFRGIHPVFRRIIFHTNLGMLVSLAKQRPTWLMLGGSWAFPTVVALLWLRSILAKTTKVLLWSEANASASEHPSKIGDIARRHLYGLADAYVTPGITAERTLKEWRVPQRPLLNLPNIVDESVFRERVAEARRTRSEIRTGFNVAINDLFVLIPSRLHEATKGLGNFLRAIETVTDPRVRIFLAGEGPDRARLLDEFQNRADIAFLGQQTESNMVELFAAADLMVLPSWKDPNPLAVIEALWAGLPLMISKHCGNWPEALQPGINGWLIDPADPEEIKSHWREFVAMPANQREELGAASGRIASRFATSFVVQKFLDQLEIG
jgi:glycosyltransferase involved in cell wall biosynthesis